MTNNYELRIETSEFKKALDVLSTVINKKNALPILGDACIRYDRERKLFTMTAGNSEQFIELECWRQDENADDGHSRWMFNDSHGRGDDKREPLEAFCVSVDDFREAFATLPSMPAMCYLSLDAEMNGGSIRVTYGKGEFTLPVDLATEYPQVQKVVERDGEEKREGVQPLVKFSIETLRLLPLIAAARVCSASDDLRPVMNTVCIDVFHDKAVVVATDGQSLYRQGIDTGMGWLRYGEFPANEGTNLLIPSQSLQPLVKALAGEESMTLTADSQRISFENATGSIRLTSVCIEGRYPNYDSVIPRDNQHRIVLDCADLIATLRRISLFSSEASNLCVLRRNEGHVVFNANDGDFGRNADEQVAIVNDDCTLAEGTQIGFKISTMQKLLQCISSDNVVIEIGSPERALLLKEDMDASSLTLLLMPVLVNQ